MALTLLKPSALVGWVLDSMIFHSCFAVFRTNHRSHFLLLPALVSLQQRSSLRAVCSPLIRRMRKDLNVTV